jgi:prepilin-type N-terminal cleavage/methylation domain-containing protein
MASSIIRSDGINRARKQAASGFSLLEVVISMAILTVGLVSLLGVFGLAMASTLTSQEDMIAKQLANEALESIVTARNTSQLGWDDIQNVGSTTCTGAANPCGIFVSGATSINNAGADGIFGTSDDSSAGIATLNEPGPDGIYGNSDDVQIPLTGYQRTILISQVTDSNGSVIASLRGINITIQYSTTQTRQPKTYVLSSFISQYQ